MDGLSQLGLVLYGRSVTNRAGAGMEGLSQLGLDLVWKVCHN